MVCLLKVHLSPGLSATTITHFDRMVKRGKSRSRALARRTRCTGRLEFLYTPFSLSSAQKKAPQNRAFGTSIAAQQPATHLGRRKCR
ncbi:MAG: hypothetical protein A3G25_03550 [Betaproteobacteria bacterium RIFCSPLOWO2_12_FULL_63_13]|nr:MAG: hypothetical protein A3G25_03550 [Betaproteobacteria bacterium RIFCSPLOWO2_12_FULL_63_13]